MTQPTAVEEDGPDAEARKVAARVCIASAVFVVAVLAATAWRAFR